MKETKWKDHLSEDQVEFTSPDIMLKLVSTIDKRGWPHITIITSNRAVSADQVVWGEFSKGQSKENIHYNPKEGIFYMTADMPFKCMQVKAEFTHMKSEGPDIEYFNKSDLMRYMTYINIYHVYYSNVRAASPIRNLSLLGIVSGLLKVFFSKGAAKTKLEEKRLREVGYNLFRGPINPKFISYIDPEDGYPIIIPVIPLQAADHNRLVFPRSVFKEDLEKIPAGENVAVLAMNMDLASQHVNGTFKGYEKFRGVKLGVIEIEEVYNSAPPMPGVIYPDLYHREKVTEFNY